MSTSVPAVIDALVTMSSRAVPNATVLDGPAGARSVGVDVISIGLAADDLFAADITQERLPGMGDQIEESFSITCAVSASTGGSVFKPARDRCVQMIDALRAELRSDETLGRTVQVAWINVKRLSQGHDGGAYADLTFTVDGRSYL